MTDQSTQPVPELPGNYMEYVGRVAMAWATFQWLLDDAIGALAGLDPLKGAAFMTNIISLPGKESTFKTLLALRKCPSDLQEEMQGLINRAGRLGKRRNAIVHGVLLVSYETKSILRRNSKFTSAELRTTEANTKELIDILREISALSEQFLTLFHRINSAVEPLTLP